MLFNVLRVLECEGVVNGGLAGCVGTGMVKGGNQAEKRGRLC